ncbi:flagellar protein [Paenibacillus mesophilus]|uniref:flagellar protein n=1 Tax=Paenibacillus mesophilus TaxID=2582849 RepID=UPI00110F56EE|nr:flagellar protein [Paenibacillus mesophilus]TMV47328.1 flagellar protein [Paenibacillus mesophilus]
MNLKVDHCPGCGSIYQKNFRNMCSTCSMKMDRDLADCIDHLWKFPNVTTDELSEATQISVTSIYKFIKEGKIAKTYGRLTYPCECCGVSIRSNRLCGDCSQTFKEAAKQIKATLIRTPANVYNINK